MSDERPFLHDLSNPLTTIIMIVDTLLLRLSKNTTTQDEHLNSQLRTVMELLNEVRILIKRRREVLIQRGQ